MKSKGKPKNRGKPEPVLHGQQDVAKEALSSYGRHRKAKAKK